MKEYVDSDCKWAVRAVDAKGKVFWYTGRAGDKWVSPSDLDAYYFYSENVARNRASRFNRMMDIHGLRFIALRPIGS